MALLTEVLEVRIDLLVHGGANRPRHTDATRRGQRLQTGRDVDAITEDVSVIIDDDISQNRVDFGTESVSSSFPRVLAMISTVPGLLWCV